MSQVNKKNTKAKNKGGRPRIQIDWSQFDNLCKIQCTLREISAFFDCSEDTIERCVKREFGVGFADYFEQKRGLGQISLRRKQFETAMAGNVTMQIWLGKQILNQSDKIEKKQENSFVDENGNSTLKIEFVGLDD